jgi:Cu2+-containing amine oxidase
MSGYRYHWVSPYTILKAVCFWEKDDDVFYNHLDEPNHKYDKWINRLMPFCTALTMASLVRSM